MLQRKVKEITMKNSERKAGMWLQEPEHFPARAMPTSSVVFSTQLHPEYTYTHTQKRKGRLKQIN
jgi:hypothetical protein